MKVLVVGASENSERYSNMAIQLLKKHNHEVLAVGAREGRVGDTVIHREFPSDEINTVTLYVGPDRQNNIMEKIISLHPKRVIFNPGTENPNFYKKLSKAGISFEEACTLVLLNTNAF